MQARFLDEKVVVRSAAGETSDVVSELHHGDEITLGDTVKKGAAAWIAVTLGSGVSGYVPGQTTLYRFHPAVLAETSVDVLEVPAVGSGVTMIFKEGEKFTITGLTTGDDGTQWLEVRSESGENGYIQSTTKVTETKKKVDNSTAHAIGGIVLAGYVVSQLPSFGGTVTNFVVGGIVGVACVGLFGLTGALVDRWVNSRNSQT